MTTPGDPLPRRGEVWWIRADKLRPALVVQTDSVRQARIGSYLVVPLTSRIHLEGLPGNVRLSQEVTGLSKTSIANVYDVQKVLRGGFVKHQGTLPNEALSRVAEGLRLVLDL